MPTVGKAKKLVNPTGDRSELQILAITDLETAMEGFARALGNCTKAGLTPVESFRAIGIEIPLFVAPVLNMIPPDFADQFARK